MTLVYITHVGISAYVCNVDPMTLVYITHVGISAYVCNVDPMTPVYNEQWHSSTLHTSALVPMCVL